MAFAQSDQDVDSNMSCVERLEMPVYPPLAHMAQVSASVSATVIASANGPLQITFSPRAHPLLAPSVENALRASAFNKACAGKPVSLIFSFVIDKQLEAGHKERISFGYPNRFWISVPPPPLMVSQP
jgi:hypothetical protein